MLGLPGHATRQEYLACMSDCAAVAILPARQYKVQAHLEEVLRSLPWLHTGWFDSLGQLDDIRSSMNEYVLAKTVHIRAQKEKSN